MKNNLKERKTSPIRLSSFSNRFAAAFLSVLLLVLSNAESSATLIFSENMGTPGGTTSVAANTFQNSSTLTYSGSGDVRITTPSSGYSAASGGGNVFLTGAGAMANFIIGSINTVGYSGLVLSFGAFKSTTASAMSELRLSYSINGGSSYSALTIPAQATGTGTAVWRMISGISLPSDAAGVTDLRIQWVNSDLSGSPDPQFRLDDVKLEATAVPEASTWYAGIGLTLGMLVTFVRRIRK